MRDQTRRPVSCVSTRKQALGGMGWDGMGWDSMVWDGMKWDEMGSVTLFFPSCPVSLVSLHLLPSLSPLGLSRVHLLGPRVSVALVRKRKRDVYQEDEEDEGEEEEEEEEGGREEKEEEEEG
ncbi:hypothetical protein HZH66_013337 [Vespula vulgaris]|uniref:Uncharacterized protein n=1 Tax=Vespula vulgaris TaxID=7454 RepID=A0A834MRX2_VESVU|nr:hypothetical protein HZH66_013337 [Vespula vulgaris]